MGSEEGRRGGGDGLRGGGGGYSEYAEGGAVEYGGNWEDGNVGGGPVIVGEEVRNDGWFTPIDM